MNFCAAAWGNLWRVTLPLENRFAQAQAHCAQLLDQGMDVGATADVRPDIDAPMAFAAFSFGPQGQAPPWQRWQGGQLYVPGTLVYRRRLATGMHCSRIAAVAITARCDDAALAKALRQITVNLHADAMASPGAAPRLTTESEAPQRASLHLLEDKATWIAAGACC